MLICPQCHFENPNTHKFCQRCGTSLIHKVCPECDTQVPVNAETCHNCGTFTGTVWWAIIAKDPEYGVTSTPAPEGSSTDSEPIARPTDLESSAQPTPTQESESASAAIPDNPNADAEVLSQETDQPETAKSSTLTAQSTVESDQEAQASSQTDQVEPNSTEASSTATSEASDAYTAPPIAYLDAQQRYRLIEPLNRDTLADAPAGSKTFVKVLDCQPFQKSLLQALLEQQSEQSPSQSSPILGIPAIAQPYLALKPNHYPTVPEVHDAWQQDNQSVMLLEDRSSWQLLGDLWGSEELSTLQLLYWLDEMARLWQALEPWHCRQSLLEITNLRVDEDQVLGLERLHRDSEDDPPLLEDLGQMWRLLFNQSQRTQLTSLGTVFRQMCTQEITTIDQLRSQLEAIAHAEEEAQEKQATAASLDLEEPLSDEEISFLEMPTGETGGSYDDGGPTVVLPMQLLSLDDVGCTDIGRQRDHNEDCFGIQAQVKKHETPIGRTLDARGLYILCDGMGGHAAGEVASSMAVDKLKEYFQEHWQDELPTEETIHEAVRLTNQDIYDVNQQNARSGSGRMGTTLAMMLIQNTNVAIAHVGDSRLYRLTRKGGLEQLTVDHEVGQREMKRGVEEAIAYSRPDAYQLTQALGPRSDQFVTPDINFLELNEDTLFVLCSDGLSDNEVIENNWQTHLAPLLSSRANLEQGILQLVDLANEQNGHDNITAILIRVKVRPNFQQRSWS
ncbi:MAG: serine/threonine phosphatase [Coleofasciculus sp. C1-SOL-03]|uniref:serine/threonine phosphatase n=1 Tax=Coleofasciculus sp. C1-SOL-03 TaxID=3069522 RepID=UPI0032FC56B2